MAFSNCIEKMSDLTVNLNLLDLPDEMILKIFSFMDMGGVYCSSTYKEQSSKIYEN